MTIIISTQSQNVHCHWPYKSSTNWYLLFAAAAAASPLLVVASIADLADTGRAAEEECREERHWLMKGGQRTVTGCCLWRAIIATDDSVTHLACPFLHSSHSC